MDAYEYRIVLGGSDVRAVEMEQQLNAAGADGYHVVHVDGRVVIMERPRDDI